jgi:hypothetical protein
MGDDDPEFGGIGGGPFPLTGGPYGSYGPGFGYLCGVPCCCGVFC